jgi:hypothetical protein
VDLGFFAERGASLPPGVNNLVVPVFDEEWSPIIAYYLSSSEYAKQFKYFTKHPDSSSDGETEGGVLTDASVTSENMPTFGPDDGRPGGESLGPGAIATEGAWEEQKMMGRHILVRNKTHIKHTYSAIMMGKDR